MKKYFLVGLVVIAVISLTGCSAQNSATPTTQTPAAATQVSSTDSSTNYKDGEYDVTGNYVSPGGPESIEVKVTLKDNVITDATVISNAERPQTKQFQAMFIENFKPQVIGKNINEVTLTKVSGSSLTPKGFNDAIEKIKTEAKV